MYQLVLYIPLLSMLLLSACTQSIHGHRMNNDAIEFLKIGHKRHEVIEIMGVPSVETRNHGSRNIFYAEITAIGPFAFANEIVQKTIIVRIELDDNDSVVNIDKRIYRNPRRAKMKQYGRIDKLVYGGGKYPKDKNHMYMYRPL